MMRLLKKMSRIVSAMLAMVLFFTFVIPMPSIAAQHALKEVTGRLAAGWWPSAAAGSAAHDPSSVARLSGGGGGLPNQTAQSSLGALAEKLDGAYRQLDERIRQGDPDEAARLLAQLREELEQLAERAEQEFADHGKRLADLQASEALERNEAFAAQFRRQFEELLQLMDRLAGRLAGNAGAKGAEQTLFARTANDGGSGLSGSGDLEALLLELRERMSPELPEPATSSDLPHRNLAREPEEPVSAGDGSGLLRQEGETQPAGVQMLPVAALARTPEPEDVLPTDEAPFDGPIASLAEELGNNPVALYEYVRNEIDYVPYPGSRKGAIGTLTEKSGNDVDQASLLIALLRYHQIPARYARGIVQLPVEQVQNWIDAETPEAALRTLGALGVPVTGVLSQGRLSHVRMEHVWVEAYVPYGEGRGGDADGPAVWVPLDPSFKIYEPVEGLDFLTISGFDADRFLQIIQSGERSGDHSAVTRIDLEAIQAEVEASLEKILDHLREHDLEQAGLDEWIGGRVIRKTSLGVLPASLPGNVIRHDGQFREVTDGMSETVTFRISEGSPFNPNTDGQDQFSVSFKTTELYGKRITLSWEPATAEDARVIEAYGGLFRTPAHLVKVKPVLKTDGTAVAEGVPVGLGYMQQFVMELKVPGETPYRIENPVTAGGFYAVVLNYGQLPASRLADLAAALERLAAENPDPDRLYADDAIGVLLDAVGAAYFAQTGINDRITARQLGVNAFPLLQELMTGYDVNVSYLFMSPVSVSEGGFYIDVDHSVYAVVSKDGNRPDERSFMLASGVFGSAMEHAIFEQLFGVPGVSAVRILEEANNRGIPIHVITQENQGDVLPRLAVSQSVKSDIQRALHQGRIAIVPEQELRFFDWQGTGYILLDPATGAAGYMLSGGTAGGSTAWVVDLASIVAIIDLVLMAITAISLMLAGSVVGAILGLALLALTVYFAYELINLMIDYYVYGDTEAGRGIIAEALLGILGAIGGGVLGKVLPELARFADNIADAVRRWLSNSNAADNIASRYGDDFLESITRNSGSDGLDDVPRLLDDLENSGMDRQLIEDIGRTYGKEGLEQAKQLIERGFDDNQIRQVLDRNIGLDDAAKLADNGIRPADYDALGINSGTEARAASRLLDEGLSAGDIGSLTRHGIRPSEISELGVRSSADAARIADALMNGSAEGLSFPTGRAGEIFLRALVGVEKSPATTQVYKRVLDPNLGDRYIDVYDPFTLTAYESKVGYQSLTNEIRNQALKDHWLLNNDPSVREVYWVFFRSSVTGQGGPSGPLREFLEGLGITVIVK